MQATSTSKFQEFTFSIPKEQAEFFKQLFQTMQVDLKPAEKIIDTATKPKKARTSIARDFIKGYKEMMAIERGELKGLSEEEFMERVRNREEKYHGK